MATYEFQCTEDGCQGITERIQPMAMPLPDSILCRFCGAEATYKFSLPAIARSGMTPHKTPIDVSIGRDAQARWQSINDRQLKRDKVRRDSGQVGLAQEQYNEFRPLTQQERTRRARVMQAVERDGYRGDEGEISSLAKRKPQ